MGKIKGQKKNEKLRVENGKCAGAGRIGGARPGSGRKKKPTLGFPVNAGRMFADAVVQLSLAVEKHPYFANVVCSDAHKLQASANVRTRKNLIEEDVASGGKVDAVFMINLYVEKAIVAYAVGDSGEYARRMAQVVAVAMRMWQLGEMELKKKGGAK